MLYRFPALLLVLAVAAPARGGDGVVAEVEARMTADGSSVVGAATLHYTNEGPTELDAIVLLLYPQRFTEPEAELNDLTFPRVYPGRFSPGGMVLPGIDIEPVPFEAAPEGTYVRVPLEAPLAPGDTAVLTLPFETTVPRRYGTFGRYRWMIALNGGWLPQPAARGADGGWDLHAPPPTVAWSLDLDHDPGWSPLVNGLASASDGSSGGGMGLGVAVFAPGHVRYEGRARFLTVVLHRGQQVTAVDSPDGGLLYVGKPPTRRQQQDLADLMRGAGSLLRRAGLPAVEHGVVVVEAPLRWRLVEQGEGCVIVSDRFLEADPNMRRTHQTQLARAVMTDLLLPRMESIERSDEAPAVAEAVSWALLPRYLASRYRRNPTAKDILQPLDFIPAIEQFLYAPRYPFADEVLNNPYQYDPLAADIRRFHRRGISPRVSLLKIREQTGRLAMDAAALTYVASLAEDSPTPFLDLLDDRTAVDAHATWDEWERTLPLVNYRLDVERERVDDGWTTTIEVTRQSEGTDAPEPIEVRATVPRKRDEPATRYLLRWDGQGEDARWQLHTARRVRRVELDPRQKLLEIDRQGFILRHDNYRPRRVKLHPWWVVYSINVTEGTFEGQLGISGRTAFDNRNLFSASIFHTDAMTAGIGMGYHRYFGRSRDALYLRNRVGISAGLDIFNRRYAEVEGDLPMGAVVSVSYRYDDRFGSTFPTRGGRFSTSVHTGKAWLLEEEVPQFVGASASGSALLPIHPRFVMAWLGKAGATTANLAHMQYGLGGSNDLRGLPGNFAAGRFKLFSSVEWRYMALRDTDLRLPFGRLRGIQLVAFAEAGWVGNGAPVPEEMHVGLGAGVRFHFAYFGIFPEIGGFDIAWSPDAPSGNLLPIPLQIYLTLGQSF